MLPDREGRFKATILEHGVAETGPNRLATFVCKFALTEELVSGEWEPLPPEEGELDITGYFYLEKKDGSINTVTVDQLKAAFGWDGRDPFWLQDSDLGQLVVQVKLEFEQYDGKQRLKVRYVDAEDATPAGVPMADDNTRRTLSTRLGSKLRALAGGTPAPAPKPTGKPTAVPAPKAPVAKTATMQQAWQAFAKECPKGWEPKDIEQEWFRVLGELFPDTQLDTLTPQQWAIVLEQAPSKIVPI
jgi:hypothetical protein